MSRWLRRSLVAMMLSVALAACGGPATDPAEAETCDELIDTAVAIVSVAGDDSGGNSADEFDANRDQLRLDLATVTGRSLDLGCDPATSSDAYRRALLELNHETSRRAEVIVDGAMLDPFRTR